MELKKNPDVDPKRNSGLYFLIGLTAVLALTYIGIEMKTYEKVEEVSTEFITDNNVIDEEEAVITLPLFNVYHHHHHQHRKLLKW